MPDYDVKATGFKELSDKLLALASFETQDRIQRTALRAAGNVIAEELESVTPIRVTTAYGDSLPEGALKEAIRVRVSVPKDGEAPSTTVDFGKLSYIAHIVDIGHLNANAKDGRRHTPAHPFIRAAEAASHEAAADAYLASMQEQIDEEMSR